MGPCSVAVNRFGMPTPHCSVISPFWDEAEGLVIKAGKYIFHHLFGGAKGTVRIFVLLPSCSSASSFGTNVRPPIGFENREGSGSKMTFGMISFQACRLGH